MVRIADSGGGGDRHGRTISEFYARSSRCSFRVEKLMWLSDGKLKSIFWCKCKVILRGVRHDMTSRQWFDVAQLYSGRIFSACTKHKSYKVYSISICVAQKIIAKVAWCSLRPVR